MFFKDCSSPNGEEALAEHGGGAAAGGRRP